MRFEVCGDLLGGKVWMGTRGDEPSTWLLLANDTTYPDPGSVCLFSYASVTSGEASLY
jgi:hypothetical protein